MKSSEFTGAKGGQVLPPLEFEIATADLLDIADAEITELLMQVYVGGGFTTSREAATLFEPSAVRARGTLIGAREKSRFDLAGMVILVPPDSPARRLTEIHGAELHLLGVKPEYRRHGLGRRLLVAAINRAAPLGYSKISLVTQMSMSFAQQLYESAGFLHVDNIKRHGRDFKVYERPLGA